MRVFDRELVVIGSNEYSVQGGHCYFRSGLEQQIEDLARHFRKAYHYSPQSHLTFFGFEFSSQVVVRPFAIRHHESRRELWHRRREYWQSVRSIYAAHPGALFLVFIPDSYIGLIAAIYLKLHHATFFVRITANQIEELKVRGHRLVRKILYLLLKWPYYFFMRWLFKGVVQIYTGRKVYYTNNFAYSIVSSNIIESDIQVRPPLFATAKNLQYVGRFDTLKGLEYFFAAIPLVKSKISVRIVGFGEPADVAKVKRRVASLSAYYDITFVGQVPYGPKLFAEYDQADIVVMPSLYETQGKAHLEAMARGVAVVATNIPAISAIIVNGINGLLVPPRSREAIAEAIDILIADNNLRTKLVTNAYQTIRGLTMQKSTNAIINALNDHQLI
ncbi:MAG: glycosyltransferase [Candidatus Magasanikbacteria bacterium]|nr:glycosyltransferase [Candidatus Magasanikbacteria bacterium]